MFKKKIKMIYDASLVASGHVDSSVKTGIYCVALNVLKGFANNEDIDLTFYVENGLKKYLEEELETLFKGRKFEIIEEETFDFYNKLKTKKQKAKEEKKPVKKLLFQILMLLFSSFKKWIGKGIKADCKNYNVFFSPLFEIPTKFARAKNIKKFTVLHDVIPVLMPKTTPASDKNSWYMKMFKRINKNDYYFTVSNSTRNDYLRLCPQINPKKITTTLLACDEKFKPASKEEIENVKAKYGIKNKYIFSLCTLEPRKNLIMLVKSFISFIKKNNIDDMVLVLGGGHFDVFISKFESEIEKLGEYKNKIIRAGYVPDSDLAPLYSGSEWFAYTSEYEGFGLPPLEAMSCGCPVITSNNSSLPEVVGDSAIIVNSYSEEEHIKAYEKYYFNPEIRKEYAKKGLERAKLFSWEKCVNEMMDVMKGE